MNVLSWGCPRSGSTIFAHVMKAAEASGHIANKVGDANNIHPANRRPGRLFDVWKLLKPRVVFVRIVRHPVSIFESFYATRRPELRDDYPVISRRQDEDIFGFIERESDITAAQIELGLPVHTVQYEQLWTECGIDALHDAVDALLGLEAAGAIRERCRREFGSRDHAARSGRLSAGISGPLLSGRKRRAVCKRLAPVLEREGYA